MASFSRKRTAEFLDDDDELQQEPLAQQPDEILEDAEQSTEIPELVQDVVCVIMEHMSLSARHNAAKVCKMWKIAADDDRFWRRVNLADEVLEDEDDMPLDWVTQIPNALACHPDMLSLIAVRRNSNGQLEPCRRFTHKEVRHLMRRLTKLEHLEIGISTLLKDAFETMYLLDNLVKLVVVGNERIRTYVPPPLPAPAGAEQPEPLAIQEVQPLAVVQGIQQGMEQFQQQVVDLQEQNEQLGQQAQQAAQQLALLEQDLQHGQLDQQEVQQLQQQVNQLGQQAHQHHLMQVELQQQLNINAVQPMAAPPLNQIPPFVPQPDHPHLQQPNHIFMQNLEQQQQQEQAPQQQQPQAVGAHHADHHQDLFGDVVLLGQGVDADDDEEEGDAIGGFGQQLVGGNQQFVPQQPPPQPAAFNHHHHHHHHHNHHGISHIATLRLPSLQELTLAYAAVPGMLSLSCRELRSLELIQIDFESFSWHAVSKHLTSITIDHCTTHHLSSLLEAPTAPDGPVKLKELTVKRVPHLNDALLTTVGRSTTLQNLRLESVPINGTALRGGDDIWQSLRCLDLRECDALTKENLETALQRMLSLEELTLGSMASVSSLTIARPRLYKLRLVNPRYLHTLKVRCIYLDSFILDHPQHPGQPAARNLQSLSVVSSHLKSMCLEGCPRLVSLTLDCPALQELALSNCQLHSSELSRVVARSNVPHLATLRLVDCDRMTSLLIAHAPSLRDIKISECKLLSNLAIDAPLMHTCIVNECKELLTMKVSSNAILSLSVGGTQHIQNLDIKSTSLTELDMRGCNALSKIVLSCPSLRHVDASICAGLNDAALLALARCPALVDVQLGVCQQVSTDGWRALSLASSLKRLEVTGVVDFDPSSLIDTLPRLESLLISNSWCMHVDALMEMMQRIPTPHLKHMNLSGFKLPSSDILELTKTTECRSLHSFQVNNFEAAAGEKWPSFHSNDPLSSSLQHLSIKGGKGFEAIYFGCLPDPTAQRHLDAALIPASTPLCGIKHLQLGSHYYQRVALALPELVECEIQMCNTLKQVNLECPALKQLCIDACNALSLAAICAALKGCPALEHLNVRHCPALMLINGGQHYSRTNQKVDPAAVEAVRSVCPSLKEVVVMGIKC